MSQEKKIEELACHDPVLRACLFEACKAGLGYKEMLERMVIAQTSAKAGLQEELKRSYETRPAPTFETQVLVMPFSDGVSE